ncbi:hypothetical protein CNECB9_2260030 [Cupriavidus necator]|uniref:Uncharacterized protein n=1 Tax=Cupriavidus necator TaxID=106590 RepID=A0A1K0JIS2_CUPNE|nr:hypothetical protein CNECB9_2260030 [Cupriavidus necator]
MYEALWRMRSLLAYCFSHILKKPITKSLCNGSPLIQKGTQGKGIEWIFRVRHYLAD